MGGSQFSRTQTEGIEREEQRVRALRRALLKWGDDEGRSFFWRRPGVAPFTVLVVEILLTKTRAEMVAPVAPRLLARFPSPTALAKADRRVLERLLYPLGLHRKRARQLIACANVLIERHGGEVPRTVDALIRLPSVGRYAANAIALVAFGQRRSVIDANIARIYGRVFSLAAPPPRLSAAHGLWALASRVLPRTRSKEFTWAVLDLGGTVCAARNPDCSACPLTLICDFAARQAKNDSRNKKVAA